MADLVAVATGVGRGSGAAIALRPRAGAPTTGGTAAIAAPIPPGPVAGGGA